MKKIEIIINGDAYLVANMLNTSEKKYGKIINAIKKMAIEYSDKIKGIIVISNSKQACAKIECINRDGSLGRLPVNGIFCAVKYLYENKYTCSNEIIIEISGENKIVSFDVDKFLITNIKINLGKGSLNTIKVPMLSEKSIFINETIDNFEQKYKFTAVNMGNPHLVCFVKNLDEIDIDYMGPKLECHYLFPEHTNVEFAQVLNNNNIRVKLWERGCGKTKSCGTAACGVVYAGLISKNIQQNQEYLVHMNGEVQKVVIDEESNFNLINPYYKVYKK